jgi:DNA-binding helix-hairpin-helix protein with protein kinase domain
LKNLKNQWESNFNDTSFNTTQKNLTSSYKKYKNIKLDYNAELHTINIKAKDDQFNYYMQSTYINDWKIKGIGPKKKRGLYIHGIQVASDISSWAVDRVPGFGEKHTQTMLDWKYQMENLFVFSPNNAITLSQYKRLKNKYLKLKLGLERKIINESDKLEQINKQRLQKNDKLTDSINKLMHKLAQDEINLEEFKRKYINI